MGDTVRKPIFKKKTVRANVRNRRSTEIEEDDVDTNSTVNVEGTQTLMLHSRASTKFHRPGISTANASKRKRDISKYVNVDDEEETQLLESVLDDGVTVENISELPSHLQAQIHAQTQHAQEVTTPKKQYDLPPKKYVPLLTQQEDLRISKKELANEYKDDDQLDDENQSMDYEELDQNQIDATDLMAEGDEKLYLSSGAPRLPDVDKYDMEIDDVSHSKQSVFEKLQAKLKTLTVHKQISVVTEEIAVMKQTKESLLRTIASLKQEIAVISHQQTMLVEQWVNSNGSQDNPKLR